MYVNHYVLNIINKYLNYLTHIIYLFIVLVDGSSQSDKIFFGNIWYPDVKRFAFLTPILFGVKYKTIDIKIFWYHI